MIRTRLGAALLAILVACSTVVWPVPATTAEAASCSGVWVVVGSSVRCSSATSSGLAALRGAGFDVQTVGGGFVCRINGSPDTCTMNVPYWTYFHSTRRSDGTWGPWVYSSRGAGSYKPSAGVAEGWAYGSGSTTPSAKPPTVAPPAPKPKPTATKTTTKKPVATKTSTSKPATTTRRPASPAPASGTKSASVAASPKATPSPVVAAAAATPTAEGVDASPVGVAATPTTAAEPQAAAGSPVAALATGGVILAGGAALGVWALRRRR